VCSILFLQTKGNVPLKIGTIKQISEAIAQGLSQCHVPAFILHCPKILMTSNSKMQEMQEIAMKKMLNSAQLEDVNANH
jgi:hypothetical protein